MNQDHYILRRTARNVLRSAIGLLLDRTVLALSMLFGISLAILLWHQSIQESRLIESTAVDQAVRYSEVMSEFRTAYTSEVVKTAVDQGLDVTHDYQGKVGALPLPATLSMFVGERLSRNRSGDRVQLYSPYPFPNRSKTGGLRDNFQREAWKALNEDPDKPFIRYEKIDGRQSVRYATADRMRISCVRCHNNHPSTPKRGWKEGDVRGVLEVDVALDSVVAQVHADNQESVFAVAGLFTLGVVCLIIVVARFRQNSKELETQVAERTIELSRANVELTRTVAAKHQIEMILVQSKQNAETANQAKSEFLANMSHEIRTPMTAILGFTDILLDNVVKPENIDAVRIVKENGKYLINLINDILDLSKVETGKMEIERTDCPTHEIVADVVSLVRVRAAAKGLPLNVRFDGPVPETIQCDPTRLRQILINIVGNAIKFTETGSVEIVTRLLNEQGEEPKLRFDVIDTGIGIAEDNIDKLFLAFTQADNSTTRRFGGTGLGLAISKRLTELLGGTISVSSTIGKGSKFSVTVSTGPLEEVQMTHNAVESAVETVNVKGAEETEFPLDNYRILLVEDGPDNQRLIGFILKKAGAEVTLADNGQIAYELATAAKTENCPFDVVLMDMQMPVLDGYEATRRLREEGYTRPIIALTAHAMASDRQKCLDAGCDDYTTKPIDRRKLVSLVSHHASHQEFRKAANAPKA